MSRSERWEAHQMANTAVGRLSFMMLVLLAVACASAGTAERTRIRVWNDTGIDLAEVVVSLPDQTLRFGPLGVGERSRYESVHLAYRYASVEARAAGRSYTIQAQDYMGERPLGSGPFTYVLRLTDDELSLELERDGR